MSALQIIYYVGIVVGIAMFVASWLIRRKQITEGPLAHEFPRTVSRLNEMQSKEYLQLERRVVDTGLT